MPPRVKHFVTYTDPHDPNRKRWVIGVEQRAGRWFEVNVLDDISSAELEQLFVEAQMSIAEKQGQLERQREDAMALTEPAGPPPLDDDEGS